MMSEYRNYLTKRIQQLSNRHKSLRQSAKDHAGDEQISIAYDSQAAGIWDTKTELEAAVREYDKCHHPAVDISDTHQMD